jgi:hypothetical protein
VSKQILLNTEKLKLLPLEFKTLLVLAMAMVRGMAEFLVHLAMHSTSRLLTDDGRQT